jgi:SecD/SecF fusion protein
LKNVQAQLFILILLLTAGSLWAVISLPTRKGLDIQGGMRVVLSAQTQELKGEPWSNEKLELVTGIIRQRVDSLGVAEPVVYPKPPNQVVVELPGLTNREQALEIIQSTARLEFRRVPQLDTGEWTTRTEEINGRETGYEEIIGPNGQPVSKEELEAKVFSTEPILTGADLKPNARPNIGTGKPFIEFEFKNEKKGVFEQVTRANLGKRLAIFLDKRLISAPVINAVIPGKGIIEGNFTPDSARILANQLNAGALPVPLKQEQIVNVEATLGTQAVQKTLVAGIVGLVLVALFMLAYYKIPGLLADVALILYTLFTFAIFKLIPVTLTVPGIAGFILSIGMAVDANILIFERLKEERLAGKSIRAAIEAGFRRAFTAIFDSNVCTLITCAILYYFGTGPVRGFAVTLAIGVAVSMFTAITCSRNFLMILASTPFGQNDKLYPLGRGLHPKLNVTKRMGFWFGLSGLIILPGIAFWMLGGNKPSIEFTGGTEISAQFLNKPSVAQITAALASAGHREARVLLAEDNRAFITTKRLSPEEKDRVLNALRQNVGPFRQETVRNPRTGQTETRDVVSDSTVSAVISRELTRNAFLAVLYASVLIVLYLALRFAIPNFFEGLKFGTCAVAALLHDVLVVWGAFCILGYFLNWQIDSLFVTAMLTVIGFSVHDTIIIFDRIRENLHHRARGETFADVTDRSIEQTFARSINTSGTVVITLLALLLFGGPTIRLFVTALLIGIISGTYSSIFNASPLLVLWKRVAGEGAMLPATAGGPPITPRPVAPRPEPPARPRPTPTPQPATEPTVPPPPSQPSTSVATGSGSERSKPKKRKRRM